MSEQKVVKVAVLEDSKEYTAQMQDYLARFSDETGTQFDTTYFTNGLDFIERTDLRFDIVFSDIEMPMMNGLEAARQLRERDPDVCIIFITVMAQYALKGYEVNALDFLVKPVGYFNFSLKMKKALHAISTRAASSRSSVLLHAKTGIARVFTDEIYYVEVSGHYLNYRTKGGDITERSTMKECEEMLAPLHFSRLSNYCIANLQYVCNIEGDEAVLRDGDTEYRLPITRGRKKDFFDDLASFVRGD